MFHNLGPSLVVLVERVLFQNAEILEC